MMSASVFKPIHPNRIDVPKLRSPFSEKRFRGGIEKVRRALFEPINHEETKKFLERELAKHTISESRRWEFDFKHEVPLHPTGKGRYIWQPVRPTKETITFAPKRKRSLDEDVDNSHLYSQPLGEVRRPHPLRADENRCAIHAPVAEGEKKQRLITEFMKAKKRPAESAFAKKLSAPKPAKISKESHCS